MSRRAGYPGGLWPDEHHELLLRAALLPDEDGWAAWRSLRDRLDPDNVDSETYRLLPLLAFNLGRMGVSDSLLQRLRGIRRRTWLEPAQRAHHR